MGREGETDHREAFASKRSWFRKQRELKPQNPNAQAELKWFKDIDDKNKIKGEVQMRFLLYPSILQVKREPTTVMIKLIFVIDSRWKFKNFK